MLCSDTLEFICEAHNPLSAKIVEEAGFNGIWGSSLTISAAMGVRDCNELSWTQVLEIVDLMTDATSVPMLLDADTGYGNFNSVRRLVKKLEERSVAAICIEDKLFPKKNSFINGDRQPLADIDEFAGKIKAAKDAQRDQHFSVIARVEALIAGWGVGEAIRRADAYHRAGADGILIHSKSSKPDEVLAFKKEWSDRCPVVIVPTKYYMTPVDVFRSAGFSLVIWANMILRSGLHAMKTTAQQLAQEESLINIEDRITPISEVFRLQGSDELERAEKVYLPGESESTCVVILAASQGKDLGALTSDRPKALLEIGGKPLLYKQVDILNESGLKDIIVVRGFRKEMIDADNLRYIDNDDYASTQEVVSLFQGIKNAQGRTIVSYGDILYRKYVPSMLLESNGDIVAVVDADWKSRSVDGRYADFVSCDQPFRRHLLDQEVQMTAAGSASLQKGLCGEWIGLLKLSPQGLSIMQDLLAELSLNPEFGKVRMVDVFNELIRRGHRIEVMYIWGNWMDVDDIRDIGPASAF